MTRNPKRAASYPNLYLLGFMGTGKSSVGRRIAARLGMKFLDSDAEIEKSAGMEIKDIFAKFGEEKFREMERKFIESGHPDSGCVVSCGGGLCCRDGMPELVRGRGVCVVLFSTPEEICERVSKSDKRPLVNVENPEEYIDIASCGDGADSQDKGSGKAMTYAFKYMWLRAFALPTGEDPDKISSAELDEKLKYVCADCGIPISNTKTRSGEIWEADKIAAYAEQRHHRVLCPDCIKVADKVMDKVQ